MVGDGEAWREDSAGVPPVQDLIISTAGYGGTVRHMQQICIGFLPFLTVWRACLSAQPSNGTVGRCWRRSLRIASGGGGDFKWEAAGGISAKWEGPAPAEDIGGGGWAMDHDGGLVDLSHLRLRVVQARQDRPLSGR